MITAVVFFISLSLLSALAPVCFARSVRKAWYFVFFQMIAAVLSLSMVLPSIDSGHYALLGEFRWFFLALYLGAGVLFFLSLFVERLMASFRVWFLLAGWLLSALLAPAAVAPAGISQGINPLFVCVSLCIFVSVLLASGWQILVVTSEVLSLPAASHQRFLFGSFLRASACAALVSFFVWFSLPSIAAAESLPIVLSFGSASFSAVTSYTLVHEDRLGLIHLFRRSIDDRRLSDKELDVVLTALRQLRHALSQNTMLPSRHLLGDSVITVGSDGGIPDVPDLIQQQVPPKGWIEGTLHARDLLRLEVGRDLGIIQSLDNGPVTEEGLTFGARAVGLSEYQKLISQNRSLNGDRYGCDLIGVSPEFRQNLFQLKEARGAAYPVFINGEPGVGKGALAVQALKMLGCDDIIEFDAKDPLIQISLVHNIREIKASPGIQKGLIIENAECIPSEQWSALCQALEGSSVSQAVAVTGSTIPEAYPNQATVISILPLRERPRDLFYLAIHFILEAERDLQRGVTHVSSSFVNALFQHSWPGNCNELREVCRKAVLNGQSQIITTLPI